MSVSGSPLAVDRRECQEVAVADSSTCLSPSRAETSQKLRCLDYASGHLNVTFTSLLICSFLQSPAHCPLSPPHSPLSSEMLASEQFFLPPLFHLFFESVFPFQVKQLFNLWYALPQPSLPIISLHIPVVLSLAFLVLTSSHC